MVSKFIYTVTTLFIYLQLTNGEFGGWFSRNIEQLKVITVDAFSQTGPSTIQAAVNAVPSNNQNWITIKVKAGVYKEQVTIPIDKPFIYLKGEGIGKTNVVYGATSLNSPTFNSMADHILVSGITFKNSYNYPPNKNKKEVKRALAARISGDKSAFYQCSFLGYQDTLWDAIGRHYFVDCTIEGAIDFIFGNAQSIYQNCKILVNANPSIRGYITAQGRESPKGSGGFVFKKCSVGGSGKTMLGRAWKGYSFVIFYDSFLSKVVLPPGWSAWKSNGHENRLTFVEAECHGPGSNKSKRVRWEKTLSPQVLKSFTSISYIDNEGWISKLPIHIKY